jgi:hypothetical protein
MTNGHALHVIINFTAAIDNTGNVSKWHDIGLNRRIDFRI